MLINLLLKVFERFMALTEYEVRLKVLEIHFDAFRLATVIGVDVQTLRVFGVIVMAYII